MGHLETALTRLRPMVIGTNCWDYCALWKLGDDPSRFFEFAGCCCNGAENGQVKNGNKRIKKEQSLSIEYCKDTSFPHHADTKACLALSRLPSFLPLYSGIHGEVVTLGQPRWFNIVNKASDSESSYEQSFETQVFIPVEGGLVELFSANIVPEDQRITEFVMSQFGSSLELQTLSSSPLSFDGQSVYPLLKTAVLPLPQPLITIARPNLDGSSTGSFPSDNHTSPDSNPCSVISQSTQLTLYDYGCNGHVSTKDVTKGRQRGEKKECKSKNLHTERRRRTKIRDGLYTLRALVPNITKMDRASILGDAIDYIEELENEMKELHNQLLNVQQEDSEKYMSEQKVSRFFGEVGHKPKLEVQVNVDQLSSGQFLLRINCKQSPGAFTKLLEALGSLGVDMNDVKDANVTTCDGKMWSILTISTTNDVTEKDLKESLKRVAA